MYIRFDLVVLDKIADPGGIAAPELIVFSRTLKNKVTFLVSIFVMFKKEWYPLRSKVLDPSYCYFGKHSPPS